VCVWDGGRWFAWRECYRATIDDAVRRIDRANLTALHLHLTSARPG